MIVYTRILIHVLAGWLLASGYINEEVKSLLTDDPEFALAIQTAIAAAVHGVGVAWWRLSKRMGWAT